MSPVSLRPAVRAAGAAVLLLGSAGLRGQGAQAVPPPVSSPAPDLSGDMAPMDDLGVAWPDPTRADASAVPPQAGQPPASAGQQERYRVVLDGADDLGAGFRGRFDQLSTLVLNAGKPANVAQIDRRAQDDKLLVRDLLHAAGRYDGTVEARLDAAAGAAPATVHLTIVPGPAYAFATVSLPGLERAGPGWDALAAQFAVRPGDPVDADPVLAATAAFQAALQKEGYPFARLGDPRVTVDHAAHSAALAVPVTPGTRARFGRIVRQGPDPLFSERHLGVIARFRPGQSYDATRLDDFRRALIATGLVSVATVTPVAGADPGVVDVAVRIDRAPPRTIAGALGYGTGQGALAQVSWTNRNLVHPEGAVTFAGALGTREQSLSAVLRRGNFHARDRVFTGQVIASHADLNAYDARTFTLSGTIERQTNIIWQKRWVWSGGAEFVATDERDTVIATGAARRRTFLVAALPGTLAYDGTDDLLNPTRGYRLAGRVSPEVSLQNGADAYVKLQLDASAYQPIGRRLVLAGRVRFGSIDGAPRDGIAPSRRFYAGGGGSVRGYGYQDIGPLDVNGQPVGGRALTEFGAEARIRFGAFGVVPFLDAGNLYTASTPRVSGLRYGTGLGARYYSSFGPIRVDVGTPIGRRPGESRVAIYVSLGQAF